MVSEAERQLSLLRGDIKAVRDRHLVLHDKLKVRKKPTRQTVALALE
jgi:hypothetical protein